MAEEAKQGDFGLNVETINKPAVPKARKVKKVQQQKTPLIDLPAVFEPVEKPQITDVTTLHDKINPVMERLIRRQEKAQSPEDLSDDLAAVYEEIVLPFIGLPSKRVEGKNFFAQGKLTHSDEELIADSLFSNSDGIRVRISALIGANALMAAHSPEISRAVIYGKNALAGGNLDAVDNNGRNLDCEDVDILDSVVFGENALLNVHRGLIKDSIIGGKNALKYAWGGLRLQNVWVVDQYGAHYHKDFVFKDMDRPNQKLQKPYEAATSNRFIGKKGW